MTMLNLKHSPLSPSPNSPSPNSPSPNSPSPDSLSPASPSPRSPFLRSPSPMSPSPLKIFFVLTILFTVASAAVDLTLKAESYGTMMIADTVVSKVESSCFFGQEVLLARRFAYWSMHNSSEGLGGIWKIPREAFEKQLDKSNLQQIEASFNIDWSNVTWNDMAVPLYSGLSFFMHMRFLSNAHQQPIPQDAYQQGEFLQRFYWPDLSPWDFERAINEYENSTCVNTDADVLVVAAWEGDMNEGDLASIQNALRNLLTSQNYQVNFALAQLSDKFKVLFDFSSHPSSRSQGIDQLQNSFSGELDFHMALKSISKEVFSPASGARSYAKKEVLFLVGGSEGIVKEKRGGRRGGRRGNGGHAIGRRHSQRFVEGDIIFVSVDLQNRAELAKSLSTPGIIDDCWNSMSVSAANLMANLNYIRNKICLEPQFIAPQKNDLYISSSRVSYCKIELPNMSNNISIRVLYTSNVFYGYIYFSEHPYVNEAFYDHRVLLEDYETLKTTLTRPSSDNKFMYCYVIGIFGSPALLEFKVEPKKWGFEKETNVSTASTTTPASITTEFSVDDEKHRSTERSDERQTQTQMTTTSVPVQETTSAGMTYNCDANNPCKGLARGQRGVHFPHDDPTKYIVCWGACLLFECPWARHWDQGAYMCVWDDPEYGRMWG